MRNGTWGVLAWVIMLCSPTPLHGQDPILQTAGVRAYINRVLAGNAHYAAARSRVAAATERIAPAGALPDPTLGLGVIAVPAPSFDFTAERMTRLPVKIQQRFPFPGKQAAATGLARADSAVIGESFESVEARLVAAAVQVYYELAYAETSVDVWRARVTLANQAIVTARARYETGAVPQTDLLRARLRRAELVEEGSALEAAVTRAHAGVDALRGRPDSTMTALSLLTPDGRSTVDVQDDSLDADALMQQLADTSPALRVAAARVQRAQRNAHVFNIASRPDFTVSLQQGIRFGGRQPFVTALVGISVPLWAGRKQSPAARAARFDLDAARQEYDDLRARLIGDLRDKVATIEALKARERQTSREIIPLADAASTSALQRYTVGAVEFTTVLETQDNVFRARLRLARLIADYGASLAQLAALVGEEWYR